jgi:acetylornithine deacetylase
MSLIIDEQFLIQTLVDMVRINSCNPSLTGGSPGESEIGEYVAAVMKPIGLDVAVHELGSKRVNVVGIYRGSGGGRSLMWNAHMDTVGVEGMEAPFSGEIRDGRLFGRGSQDMKASLAAMLAAVKALKNENIELAGDLILTAVADEEHASIGTEDIVKNYHADAAIVTEPTDLALCRAHRGFIWYDVDTFGRAAHGSRYNEGIDAIMRMGRFLGELDELEKQLRQRPPHPLAGPPSLHAALIEGGSEISVYAAHCKLQVERRTSPGETVDEATEELQFIADQLSSADPTFKATINPKFVRSPFEVSEEAHIARILEAAITERLGKAPEHIGATFWTDAALLADAGIETVIAGPVGSGLHSAEEWVDLGSAVDLAHILAETCIIYCRS